MRVLDLHSGGHFWQPTGYNRRYQCSICKALCLDPASVTLTCFQFAAHRADGRRLRHQTPSRERLR